MSFRVSFEGIAGSGKTTACRSIKDRIGAECLIIEEFPENFLDGYMNHQSKKEPGFSYSKEFATPLTQTFMMAANAAYKLELGNGFSNLAKVSLFDRYIESVIAYQTVVMNGRFSPDVIDSLNNGIRGIFPKPDLTLYFDAPISVVKSRLENRGLNLDQDFYNFLSAVKSEFDKNLLGRPDIIKINAQDDPYKIVGFVVEKIEKMKEAHGFNRESTELRFNKK